MVCTSVWSGRKKDKTASAQVTRDNDAQAGVASVTKKLLANCKELEAIQKHVNLAKNHHHYPVTMAWDDAGWRLLTTPAYFGKNDDGHLKKMDEARVEFYRLVDAFIDAYSWEVMQAEAALGDLFNAGEYPSSHSLRSKFSFEVVYAPVPESGDFRVDVGNEAAAQLNTQYKDFFDKALAKGQKDVWERLYKALAQISERIDYNDESDKKIFKAATVDNLVDIVGLLDVLNVTGDQSMTDMQANLTRVMSGITPDALRNNSTLRKETKAGIDKAIAALPSLL
jgi:hypothetical protein